MPERLIIQSHEARHREAITRAASPWEGIPGVEVHRSLTDVPDDAIRQALILDGTISCWHDGRTSHLYLPNIADERQVRDTLLRSIAAHGSIPALLPDEKARNTFYRNIEQKFSGSYFYAKAEKEVSRDTKNADEYFHDIEDTGHRAPVFLSRQSICDKFVRESAKRFLAALKDVSFGEDGKVIIPERDPRPALQRDLRADLESFLSITGEILRSSSLNTETKLPVDELVFFLTRAGSLTEEKADIASSLALGLVEDFEPIKVLRDRILAEHHKQSYDAEKEQVFRTKYIEASRGTATAYSDKEYLNLGIVSPELVSYYGVPSRSIISLPLKSLLGDAGEKSRRHSIDIDAFFDGQNGSPVEGYKSNGIVEAIRRPLLLADQDYSLHTGRGCRLFTGLMELNEHGLPFLCVCPVSFPADQYHQNNFISTAYQLSAPKILNLFYHGSVKFISEEFAEKVFPVLESKTIEFYGNLLEASKFNPDKAEAMLRSLQENEDTISISATNLTLSRCSSDALESAIREETKAMIERLEIVRGLVKRGTVRPSVAKGVDLRHTETMGPAVASYAKKNLSAVNCRWAPGLGLYSAADREAVLAEPLKQLLLDRCVNTDPVKPRLTPMTPYGRSFDSTERVRLSLWCEANPDSVPVFFSRKELERYGLSPKGEGVIISVQQSGTDGKTEYLPVRYWSVSDTDFAERYPGDAKAFSQFISDMESKAAQKHDDAFSQSRQDIYTEAIRNVLPGTLPVQTKEAVAQVFASSFSGATPAFPPEAAQALRDELSALDSRVFLDVCNVATTAVKDKVKEISSEWEVRSITLGEVNGAIYQSLKGMMADGTVASQAADLAHPYDFINLVTFARGRDWGKREIPSLASPSDRALKPKTGISTRR